MRIGQMKLVTNLLASLPDATAGEITEALVTAQGVRLERIVSHGQASPEGFWYDQDEAEWIVVLSGSARLAIDGESFARMQERRKITLIDLDRLVELWVEFYPKLDDLARNRLRL